MSSGKSYLTEWQRRVLEATARGEVKRSYVAEGSLNRPGFAGGSNS